MLRIIKTVHTIIWLVMASATSYILYAGITATFTKMLYICLGLLVLETAVLVFNKWTCPLTPMARRYSDEKSDNFDIYLPNWLAKYNKIIFGIIFIAGILLVTFNWFRN